MSGPLRHVDPPPGRAASAPYNFVPLPERVLSARELLGIGADDPVPWTQQDRWAEGTLRGQIAVRLVAETPVFVRSGKEPGDTRETRLRYQHYTVRGPSGQAHAAIPGSSWRGWVRTLAEILSCARMGDAVSSEGAWYRTVDTTRLGKEYVQRVAKASVKAPGGWARRRSDGSWELEPAELTLRVRQSVLTAASLPIDRPGETIDVDVEMPASGDHVDRIQRSQGSPPARWRRGQLVMTGQMRVRDPRKSKQHETVLIPHGSRAPQTYPIDDDLIDGFNADDQITQFQEKSFKWSAGSPERPRPGALGDGDPVFYLLEQDKIVGFGRSRMFRIRYDKSARDLLPADHLPGGEPDLAEAVFGRVGGDASIRGRVRFETLVADSPLQARDEDIRIPKVLSSPKTTTYPHYLVQDGGAGSLGLSTFLASDRTTLRGHKLYWTPKGADDVEWLSDEQPNRQALLEVAKGGRAPSERIRERGRSQLTLMQPVPPGTAFTGTVRFEGLTPVELGLLITALRPFDEARTRLGAGKPHGLGSLCCEALELKLIDSEARYESWAASGLTQPDPAEPERGADACRSAFARALLECAATEPRLDGRAGLSLMRRFDALRLLLTPRDKWRSEARQLGLSEFRDRLVLPTPHAVAGEALPENVVREDRRRTAVAGAPPAVPGSGRGGGRPPQRRMSGPKRPAPRETREGSGVPMNTPTRTPRPGRGLLSEPPVGAKLEATVRTDKTKKGGLRLDLDGYPAIFAVPHPSSPPLGDLSPGTKLRVEVLTGGRFPQVRRIDS